MPEGGELRIELAVVDGNATLAPGLAVGPTGPQVLLTISDTGIGMSEEVQARAFEPFFTTKPNGQGTGLGLSTVYGIVNQSDGVITLNSEPGVGTTFRIALPLATGPLDVIAPSAPGPAQTQGSETVLVADDNAAIRVFARRALEREGYTVLEGSGADALEIGQRHDQSIHLLLTDVVMPGVGGLALADALRALRPALRVVYMSGYTVAMHRAESARTPGTFLQKPFSTVELTRTVRETLDVARVAGPVG
jgi:CheY-like chemotaxis protein